MSFRHGMALYHCLDRPIYLPFRHHRTKFLDLDQPLAPLQALPFLQVDDCLLAWSTCIIIALSSGMAFLRCEDP